MKKLLFVFLSFALAFIPFQVFADGTSGCGLGSQIWKGQKGLFAHTSASTTNGTSMNNLSGMTSGTSGCDVDKTVKLDQQQKVFVAKNHEALSDDMSMGQGEFLVAYSKLLGCENAVYPTFSRTTQENFEAIFINSDTAENVLSNTKDIMLRVPELAHSCAAL